MTMETLARSDITRLGALLRSPTASDSLTRAVEGDKRLTLLPVTQGRLDLAQLKTLRGDLLIVEIDGGVSTEIDALGAYLAAGGTPPVIVTSSSFDVQSMRALMNIGISDVLPQPISAYDLSKAVNAILERRGQTATPNRPRKGPVISFIKGGGGVGATSLIVQGTCAIVNGKHPSAPVVLDLDVQFGAAAILIDAEQRLSIFDLVRDPGRLDGALLGAAMARPNGRFDLLAAPAQILPADSLDAVAVNAVINLASQTYGATLIDLPMLWNHWVRAVLEASDVIVLVIRLTVPSLRRARAQIDMLRTEGLQDVPLFIVANAVDAGFFGTTGPSLKKAEMALGRRIDFCIPNSDAMQSAADRGQPLSEISGGKSLETKLASMMGAIVARADTTQLARAIAS
jgi:pilus assembly protein CpaE